MSKFEGMCFQKCHDFVMEHGPNSGFVLVNGYVTGNGGGVDHGHRFGHAWVEIADGRVIVDCEAGVVVPADEYKKYGKVVDSECFRYTYQEIIDKVFFIADGDCDVDVFLPLELEPSEYELSRGQKPNRNNVRLNHGISND